MKIKKVTIKDVAQVSGFSVSTVSHVINNTRFVENKTKEKVVRAIEKLNYKPNIIARSLKGKGTKTVGLIISDIREGFFSEIIKSIELNAYKNGYNVILCDSEESIDEERFYIDVLLRKGIDGLIFAPVNTDSVFKDLTSSRIPTVQVDRKLKNHRLDFVGIDNVRSAESATRYLYDQGYENAGFVGYEKRIYTMETRIEGYRRAAMERSHSGGFEIKIIPYNERKVKNVIKEWIINSRSIDAVLCGNDNICYETLSAIEELGLKIPSDFGVISFDDTKWFRFLKSPITAIRQPTWEIGKLTIDLLIDRIENRVAGEFKDILLDTELVVRDSCMKYRQVKC